MQVIKNIGPEWFTPTSEKDNEHPARFKVQTLTGLQGLSISSDLDQKDDNFKISYKGILFAIDSGLLDWENVFDENGSELAFSKKNVGHIPSTVLSEIASYIIDNSNLFGGQEKN